jgi:hypothetical protein
MECREVVSGSMKVRVGGLVIGIIFAAIDVILLLYIPSVTAQYVKGFGADIGGTLGSVFLSNTAIALVIILAVLAIPIRGIREAPKITGGAKLLQGVVLAAYYYVILNGGTVSISLLYSNIELAITATLLITLALLEISALFRILSGLFEMREPVTSPPTSAAPSAALGTSK